MKKVSTGWFDYSEPYKEREWYFFYKTIIIILLADEFHYINEIELMRGILQSVRVCCSLEGGPHPIFEK